MVHVDHGGRRVLAHVVEEVPRGAPVNEDRAVAGAFEIVGQRERAEVAPSTRRQLVAGQARELGPDAEVVDDGVMGS
jgi:hypothetical protein